MSQAALLCLLYLVLLTAATIHHYLVADAPNHSILPLIYLNTTPLENPSVHPAMYCVDLSIQLHVQFSIHPSMCTFSHPSIYLPDSLFQCLYVHPSLHSSSLSVEGRYLSAHLSIHPLKSSSERIRWLVIFRHYT